ncbi:MAG: glycosyltransferase 87 family protein [Gammaproteobacteria bacterium]
MLVGEAIARRAHALEERLGADGRGWVVWACFALLVLIARIDSADSIENVFSVYRDAGLRWVHGEDLYPAQFRFNYFPPSALLFAAFSWLPFGLEGAIWRIANIGVFAFGLFGISSCGAQPIPHARFFIATVVTVILSASAARYGQLTLAMSGLMMAAVADVESGALWRAAILVALAVALKPLALVLALLVVAIYPRVMWRTTIAVALFALLPFLFQHTDYVLRQYADVPAMLETRSHQLYEWQHLFGLLEKLGWVTTNAEQMIITGATAVLVLFLSWRARQRAPAVGAALTLYGLATCYILLFGTATERNTFAMLAPIIGLAAAMAWHTRDRDLLGFFSALAWMMLLSHTLQRAFPHTALAMAKPFACLLLFVWLAWTAIGASTGASQRLEPRPPGN